MTAARAIRLRCRDCASDSCQPDACPHTDCQLYARRSVPAAHSARMARKRILPCEKQESDPHAD